jgi:hypothetical protein
VNALRLVQTLGNYSVYVRDIKQLMLALKKEMDKGVVRSPTTSLFLKASIVVQVLLSVLTLLVAVYSKHSLPQNAERHDPPNRTARFLSL